MPLRSYYCGRFATTLTLSIGFTLIPTLYTSQPTSPAQAQIPQRIRKLPQQIQSGQLISQIPQVQIPPTPQIEQPLPQQIDQIPPTPQIEQPLPQQIDQIPQIEQPLPQLDPTYEPISPQFPQIEQPFPQFPPPSPPQPVELDPKVLEQIRQQTSRQAPPIFDQPRIDQLRLDQLRTDFPKIELPEIEPPQIEPPQINVPPPTPEQLAAQKANGLLRQGIQQYQTSQFQVALQTWQEALSVYRYEARDRNAEATVLGNLGMAYNSLAQYAKAIEAFESSLTIFRNSGNRKGEVFALIGLGDTYNSLGQFAKANELYQQSLTIARTIRDRNSETLAMYRLSRGNTDKLIELLQQSVDIARDAGDRSVEASILLDLGTAYFSQGQSLKAIKLYEQALVLARESGNRRNEAHALNNLGKVDFSLWQSPRAIEFYNQALTIFRDIGDRRSEGNVLNTLGLTLLQTGDMAAAEKHLFDAIEVWESLRSSALPDEDKVSLFETQQATYRLLQQVLIAQNKPEVALEIAEGGRARAFVELFAQRLSSDPVNSGNVPASSGSWDNLSNTCEEKQSFSRIAGFVILTPEKHCTVAPPTLEQIKQIARTQNAILVEYSIIYDDFKVQGKQQESELYIWVIKPTGEVTFRRSDLKPLWQKENITLAQFVSDTRSSIGVFRSIFEAKAVNPVNEEEQTKRLRQLHQLLIDPIADLLPTNPKERVIFIPQGELFLVPFSALQDQQGKYLIEKHTILTAPSIQVLELTRQQREKVKQAAVSGVLVLGNPTMPSVPPEIGGKPQQLTNLPGAKQEAEAIAPLLYTKALTGNQATKAAILLRLPRTRILHLATHGLFDDLRGLRSAIALAPTNTDNGLLTAEEILKLKLNAELVVLSACNTGRGSITGDGVIGLSRSLFIAGTPSVIVSLWAVPDNPTQELMTEFYRRFKVTGDKAQSLRQAMLKMMEKHRNNPRAWAAFTLIGEAE